MNKKLYRNEHNRVLGGVCSGLAEYFELDPTLVRLLFAFTFFIMGVGLGTYIILWIVLPRKGYPYHPFNNPKVDYTVPPQGSQFTPQGNPFAGNQFGTFGGTPIDNFPQKQKSNAGIIVGLVMIVLGGIILIDNLDIFWGFNVWRLWPVGLLAIGAVLIVSGQKNKPWEKHDFQNAAGNDAPAADTHPSTENTTTVE